MDYITKYQEFANQIDSCEDEEQLATLRTGMSAAFMETEFWKQRKIFLTSEDSVEKKRAYLKQQWIQQYFGCNIPIKRSVKSFKAPNGLYGIVIDPKAVVGDNCTIFQQVYIGANTLFDSDSHGLPVVGNHVYIESGVKIIGNVVIGDNVRIDANCHITRDIPSNTHVVNTNGIALLQKDKLDNTYITVNKYLDKYFQAETHVCTESDKLEVSKAVSTDIEPIIKMYKDRINWFKWKNLSQWTYYLIHHPKEEFEENIERGNYYVIKHNDQIIAGFVISSESESWEDDTSNAYYLSRAVIHTSYKNVGSFIVEQAKNIAIADGKDYLRLECVYSNKSLNNLWDSLGFKYVRDRALSYHASLREMKLFEDYSEDITAVIEDDLSKSKDL